MKLKIGRHEYEITGGDLFMDNGACIQLMTQSKEKTKWQDSCWPVLSKLAIKKISVFPSIEKKHRYGDGVKIFSLKI